MKGPSLVVGDDQPAPAFRHVPFRVPSALGPARISPSGAGTGGHPDAIMFLQFSHQNNLSFSFFFFLSTPKLRCTPLSLPLYTL